MITVKQTIKTLPIKSRLTILKKKVSMKQNMSRKNQNNKIYTHLQEREF